MRIKAGTLMKISDISALTLTQWTKKMPFSRGATKCTVSVSRIIKYTLSAFCVSDTMREEKTQNV